MPPLLDSPELGDLVDSLLKPQALIELCVLVACLLLAWALVSALRGRQVDDGSIWFGRHIVDGVLYPVAALVLTYAAKAALLGTVKLAVFKLALPMLLSLVVIRLSAKVLRAGYPQSHAVRVLERSISWAAWGMVILWVTGVLPLMLEAMEEVSWKVGATHLTLRNAVEGTITGGLVLILALWVSAAIERQLVSRGTGDSLSIRKMAANLVRVLLLFVGLLLALSTVGIDLTALSVLGGALGVGIGFGLQKIAANYVSGFVILAERSLRIGDMVRVDNFEGRITDIRTRYTVIRARNGRESIVPNEMLITQRIENLSSADPKVSLSTGVQVPYGTDVHALQHALAAVVAVVPRVLGEPAPSVQLAEFSADGMNLSIQFWISDPENGQGNVQSDVNLALLAELNRRGVVIPLPHRVMIQAATRAAAAPAATAESTPSVSSAATADAPAAIRGGSPPV